MHWVLQSDIYEEQGFEHLVSTLERLRLSYSVHKVIPFIGEITDAEQLEAMPPDTRFIVMGSYSLARQAIKRGWKPGAFLKNLDFVVQREHWGTHMFNHDAHVCRFVDVPEQPEPFFLRPVHDTKAFTGMVYDWPTYVQWRDGLIRLPETVDPVNDPLGINLMTVDTPVMVCTKKEIYTETRTWIVNRKVVTACQYKVGSFKRYEEVRGSYFDNDIYRYAEDRASEWSPDDAYVMDLFLTPGGLKIGEVNNLNSAGFYKGDMNKLVMALEDMR